MLSPHETFWSAQKEVKLHWGPNFDPRTQEVERGWLLQARLAWATEWFSHSSLLDNKKQKHKGREGQKLKTAEVWVPLTHGSFILCFTVIGITQNGNIETGKAWKVDNKLWPRKTIPNALSSVNPSFYCLGVFVWGQTCRARKLESTPSKEKEEP